MFCVARGIVLIGLLALGISNALAQQVSLGIADSGSASGFSGQAGRRLNFICPAIDKPRTEIWGTNVDAAESAVCTAAIHAGVLPMGQAGMVSIVMGNRVGSFQGSTRNGVESHSYANGGYSYTFSESLEPAAIDWSTNALSIPREYSQPVTVICASGSTNTNFVWGTDTYITDSSICTAVDIVPRTITTGGWAMTDIAP